MIGIGGVVMRERVDRAGGSLLSSSRMRNVGGKSRSEGLDERLLLLLLLDAC